MRPARAAGTLTAQLGRQLARSGPYSGAYVYDLSTQTPLFSVRADVPRPPASSRTRVSRVSGVKANCVLRPGESIRASVWHGRTRRAQRSLPGSGRLQPRDGEGSATTRR